MSKPRTRFLFPIVILSLSIIGLTRTAAADQYDADREAIAKQADAFVKAYQKGDADKLGKIWAEHGTYTDLEGRVITGREAITEDFAEFFAENKGLQLRIEILSIKFPSPDTAVEEGVTSVIGPEGTLPSRSSYTNVLVKKDGKWLLWNVRESPYVSPSQYEHLRPLEWMIGEWIEDREGTGLAHVTFEWAVDRNFILANRSILVGDALLDNGSERIGWDPAAKLIRSWNFEADGGFSHGTWTRDGNKWTSRTSAVLASGSLMTATAVVTRVDKDTITWKMTDRTLNGDMLPDTPLATMKRLK